MFLIGRRRQTDRPYSVTAATFTGAPSWHDSPDDALQRAATVAARDRTPVYVTRHRDSQPGVSYRVDPDGTIRKRFTNWIDKGVTPEEAVRGLTER